MYRKSARPFFIIMPALLLVLVFTLQIVFANGMTAELAARIASFELGMNTYIIGSRLTSDQKRIAAANMVKDSYEGTYKFHDGELFVVASRADDTVLAVYQRKEGADMAQARQMISGLMGLFAEPTAMAHDKMIYWAYNSQGKIPEEVYDLTRQDGRNLEILATVKFSSSFEITTDSDTDSEETGSIYFIITSDPLIREFINPE